MSDILRARRPQEKLGIPTVGHDPGVGKGRSSVYTSHKTHMLTFSHTQRPPTSSSMSNLLEMICTKSTSHGLAHIWDNRRSAMGVLWFVVTAVCLVIGVVTCVFLVLQFMNREAQQEVRRREKGLPCCLSVCFPCRQMQIRIVGLSSLAFP